MSKLIFSITGMIVLAPFQKQIPLYLSILCKDFITNSPKIKHLIPRAWFLSGQFSHHLKYHTIQTSLPKPLLSNLLLSLKIHSQSRLSQNVANNESKLLKMYLSSLLQEYNILEKELNRNKNHQMKASEMTSQYIELMPVAVKIRELNAKEKELQEIEEFLFGKCGIVFCLYLDLFFKRNIKTISIYKFYLKNFCMPP